MEKQTNDKGLVDIEDLKHGLHEKTGPNTLGLFEL